MRKAAFTVLLLAFCAISMHAQKSVASKNDPSKLLRKKVYKKGWEDIVEIRDYLFKKESTTKQAQKLFSRKLQGKIVHFKGYIKHIKPHLEELVDYHFTQEIEKECLPFQKFENYCGADNPNYLRVVFNGSGVTTRDTEAIMKPEKSKVNEKSLRPKKETFDDGNYLVSTFNRKFNLSGKIKYAEATYKEDGAIQYITIHVDEWSFMKGKTRK